MTSEVRPRRSLLFVPASNARALEKARDLDADVIIIDLEDSVAPSLKLSARNRAAEALARGFNGREVALRLNSIDSPWGEGDLDFVATAALDAIVVPKVSSAEEIRDITRRLDALSTPKTVRIWAMIETARAVLDADEIACTSCESTSRLDLFMLGLNDLSHETHVQISPGRATLIPWLQQVLLAARASNLTVVDAVYNGFKDIVGFERECMQARDLGFDGKSLIHPSQIPAANATFSPSTKEIEEAKALIEVYTAPKSADKGAVDFKGRMIEQVHVDIARKRLALAKAILASERSYRSQ